MADEKSFFQQHMGGYIAGAAVLAFFVAPLLPMLDPNTMMLEGSLVATGVALAWAKPTNRLEIFNAIVGLLLLIGAVAYGGYILVPAANDAATNMNRCLIYETDMVAAKPRWSNSRDLFQALGCHPQPLRLAKAQGHAGFISVGGMPLNPQLTSPASPPQPKSAAKPRT